MRKAVRLISEIPVYDCIGIPWKHSRYAAMIKTKVKVVTRIRVEMRDGILG